MQAEYCSNCGSRVGGGNFCPSCGQASSDQPEQPAAPQASTPSASDNRPPDQQVANLEAYVAQLRSTAAEWEQHVQAQQQAVESLRAELLSVEDALDIQSFGFYQPRYGFEDSDHYVSELGTIRDQQKRFIKQEQAIQFEMKWTVDGSAAKGRAAMKEQGKLMLRAFNGDCDAAIAKVKYDNVRRLETRISKSWDAINKLGKTKRASISKSYHELKLAELQLVHEHREKVYEEKAEQRRIKEQMREEERALREVEKAQKEAEKDEARHQKALEEARQELADSTGKQHDKLEALVMRLETELSEAIDRKAKSIARAQFTKSGHVYVLSNVGSFGERVYKIGMTRRSEPLDRVYELGDASVPFRFDVHAMIYCENAPALESTLHREFAHRRVNKVNTRREFFQVTLDEIRQAVAKHHGITTFVTVPEAEEYRKTRAMEEAQEPPGAEGQVA